MKKFARSRCLIGCLCVFLVLVCTFCLILPHFHEHEGLQCPVCALLSFMEGLILPLTMLANFLSVLVILIHVWQAAISQQCHSLVRLKVKLSD